MNKKILLSLSMIAAVATIVVGGTRALYSDEEKVAGNETTTGTIDIDINGNNPWSGNGFKVTDIKPGETGNINFEINNVGTNPVNVSKSLTDIKENGGVEDYDCEKVAGLDQRMASSEPECVKEGNTPVNNIQSKLEYDLSVEVYDGGNKRIWWQSIIDADEHKSIAEVYGAEGGQFVNLGMIPVDGYMKVTQSYHLNANAENEYQGDGITFGITIDGKQLTEADGYASMALENKTPDNWDILEGDSIQGVLDYKTHGSEFVYSFSGKAPVANANYTLLLVKDPWPQTGSIALGTATSDNDGNISVISGSKDLGGSWTNGKAWLVRTEDGNGANMTGWNPASYLFEAGLINYTKD